MLVANVGRDEKDGKPEGDKLGSDDGTKLGRVDGDADGKKVGIVEQLGVALGGEDGSYEEDG